MDFESTGKKLDEEIRKIVDYLENKVLPSARQDTGKLLRYASKKPDGLAEKLESEKQEK